jgi:hypothetical protein
VSFESQNTTNHGLANWNPTHASSRFAWAKCNLVITQQRALANTTGLTYYRFHSPELRIICKSNKRIYVIAQGLREESTALLSSELFADSRWHGYFSWNPAEWYNRQELRRPLSEFREQVRIIRLITRIFIVNICFQHGTRIVHNEVSNDIFSVLFQYRN